MGGKILPQYVTKRIVEMYSTKVLASLDISSQNLPAIAEEMEITTAELIIKIKKAKGECSNIETQ